MSLPASAGVPTRPHRPEAPARTPGLTPGGSGRAVLCSPPVPGEFFHASPATFTAGAVLLPGSRTGVTTVGTGVGVRLAPTLPQARSWARYLGQRLDVDAVAVYRVRVEELTAARLDLRGVLPLPEFAADEAKVLELCGWVDPWAGMSPTARASLVAAPF